MKWWNGMEGVLYCFYIAYCHSLSWQQFWETIVFCCGNCMRYSNSSWRDFIYISRMAGFGAVYADVPKWGPYGVAEQKGVWLTVLYNGFRFVLGYRDWPSYLEHPMASALLHLTPWKFNCLHIYHIPLLHEKLRQTAEHNTKQLTRKKDYK